MEVDISGRQNSQRIAEIYFPPKPCTHMIYKVQLISIIFVYFSMIDSGLLEIETA